jgi:hypothetical protein
MILRVAIFLSFLLSWNFCLKAQDTLVMLSGKTIIAKNVELGGYYLSYHTMKEKSKEKHISLENVFSIKYAGKNERVIYEADSLEPDDYNIDQMRMYIKGEQDAIKYYRNNLNKVGAFVFGGASAYFSFYGIIGPAVFSTVIGSFTPALEKQKVSDPVLLHADEYRAGYEKKIRENKTKNAILYGLAGFATGVATFVVIKNN